MGKNGVDGSGG